MDLKLEGSVIYGVNERNKKGQSKQLHRIRGRRGGNTKILQMNRMVSMELKIMLLLFGFVFGIWDGEGERRGCAGKRECR